MERVLKPCVKMTKDKRDHVLRLFLVRRVQTSAHPDREPMTKPVVILAKSSLVNQYVSLDDLLSVGEELLREAGMTHTQRH